ncbi:glycerol-3-phosphate acyltransferase [Bacillus timonensis]|nr:glycerol-3-phosphate acyltransferase [Bacillus timonensis]
MKLIPFFYLLFAYFVGTIMTGYFVIKFYMKKDIRQLGSGNVGARNAGRLLGRKGFILTFLGDSFKGALIVVGAKLLVLPIEWQIAALLAVVIGHLWPITLKFQGGKGVATLIGGLFILNSKIFLIFALVFFVLFILVKSLTVAGMLAFTTIPFLYVYYDYSLVSNCLIFLNVFLLFYSQRHHLKEKLAWY